MTTFTVGERPLFFPFLTGMLRYECLGCSAPCCKAPVLGIGRSRELVALSAVQKHVALFASPIHGGSVGMAIQSPADECWFLDDTRRCRLESHLGRDSKPAGCRLFPFQRLVQLGEALAVIPDFLCPLKVAEAPSDSGKSSHHTLALEIARTGMGPSGHPALRDPPDLPWTRAINVERKILKASLAHLSQRDYLPFALKQQALTDAAFSTPPSVDADLDGLAGQISAFLQLSPPREVEWTRQLVVLTPVLRLFASSVPRRQLPALLVATDLLVRAYGEMRGAEISATTVVRLFRQRLGLLFVLAHLLDAPTIAPLVSRTQLKKSLKNPRSALLRVIDAITQNRFTNAPITLEEILRREPRAFHAPLSADDVAMLVELGEVLLRFGVFEMRHGIFEDHSQV
jgi:Fe-S-cluster containining protein